jgi:CheY-like chemotaxis protein
MSAAHILVVDDEADIRGLLKEILSEEGYNVDVAGDAGQARASRARQLPDLVLLDIWMPDTDGITLLREWSGTAAESSCPVVMMSGHGTVETAVEATRLGAFDFVEKPLSLQKLLRTVERALEAGKRKRHAGKLLAASPGVPVGRSRVMQQLRADLTQIASNDSPVLLVGETGTGREAFARFIHDASPRAARPFVTLISSTLRGDGAEQVLFGTESNGQVAPGALERAGAGTLFVNELADLPPQAQRSLLGALESGQFMRVGGNTPVTLKARLLSSSKPGIEGRSDEFRRDLLAHLNTLIVRVKDRDELFREACRIAVEAGHFLKVWIGIGGRGSEPFRMVAAQGGDPVFFQNLEREVGRQLLAGKGLVAQALDHRFRRRGLVAFRTRLTAGLEVRVVGLAKLGRFRFMTAAATCWSTAGRPLTCSLSLRTAMRRKILCACWRNT